jgi:tetratricopeptide (TPR) repeat protein
MINFPLRDIKLKSKALKCSAHWALRSSILLLTLATNVTLADSRLFGCPADTTFDLTTAEILLQKPWDTAGLACGAQLYIADADKRTDDTAAQLTAVRANERYMYYLDKIVLYELGYLINWYVDDVPEEKKLNAPMRAMIWAQQEQQRLVHRLREANTPPAELDYFEAQTYGVSAQAQPLLLKAVTVDSPSLAGAAHALLAETYYALPDILGGDLEKAVSMMEAARQRAPKNSRFSRILSGYLLDLGQAQRATATLKKLLTLEPTSPEMQLYADQLRSASELAGRMDEPGLSADLSRTRAELLAEHPYLQTRKVVSAMGHFGSNDPREDIGNH